ncbi:hypothetical protein CWI36_1556p0010 [Hamiltosporidium magnivora]|uniref:Uncharacterized protein n=1 Tax=Hamiltosporidium magnivora TaxID=148818 RepID=A0A4Q9L2I2_9MICR|nr:hypothetical protein CWI36_1556p0010 [Hamiltosporidium magnivora]
MFCFKACNFFLLTSFGAYFLVGLKVIGLRYFMFIEISPLKIIRLIKMTLIETKGMVLLTGNLSSNFSINIGLRQGDTDLAYFVIKILRSAPEGKILRGRPRKRLPDEVEKELRKFSVLHGKNLVNNGEESKRVVKLARTFQGRSTVVSYLVRKPS